MRTEKREVYICEHCGSEFESEELCKEHEDRCYSHGAPVRVSLIYDDDFKFVLTVDLVDARRIPLTQLYENVYGDDRECTCFSIVSKDASEDHIIELKDKLIVTATELVKKTRDEYNEHYEELLKGLEDLEQVNKKEDK